MITRIAIVALVVFGGVFAVSPAFAQHPEVTGMSYCGRVDRDAQPSGGTTLYVYRKRVTCRFAMSFARRCFKRSSIPGWKYVGTDEGADFFGNRRGGTVGKKRVALSGAGGTPRCMRR